MPLHTTHQCSYSTHTGFYIIPDLFLCPTTVFFSMSHCCSTLSHSYLKCSIKLEDPQKGVLQVLKQFAIGLVHPFIHLKHIFLGTFLAILYVRLGFKHICEMQNYERDISNKQWYHWRGWQRKVYGWVKIYLKMFFMVLLYF